MDLGLSGKRALLVGAGRGIGGAAAVALAREGCSVAVVARSQQTVAAKAAECLKAGAPKAIGIAADATNGAELQQAIDTAARELQGLDILVNLVGGSAPGGTEQLTDADWESTYGRNLWPAIRATKAALPHFKATQRTDARDAAVVIHVASIWGREGGGALTYNTAKAALIALAHEQARELAPHKVRVLSVAPGSVIHPGGSWERRLKADPDAINAFVQREIPFGRFGTAEELGDVLAFLASPRASWVAGACVVVDGGQSRSF